MSAEPQRPSFGDIVSAAGLAVGLITAWLYASGWTYAYVYFDRFRIPLLKLDIPFEHYLMYGGLVVRKNVWIALMIAAGVIVLMWAVARWSARLGRFAVTTVVVLTIVVAFALAQSAGSLAALSDFAEQRHTDYSAYPRVRISREGTDMSREALAGDTLNSDCARLLAATKDLLFLIRPVRGAPSLDLDTFILPAEKTLIRIRAEYTSRSYSWHGRDSLAGVA